MGPEHPNDIFGVSNPSAILTQLDKGRYGYAYPLGGCQHRKDNRAGEGLKRMNTIHAVEWAYNQQFRDGHPFPERYKRLIATMKKQYGSPGLMVGSRIYKPPAPGPAFRQQLRGSRAPMKPVMQS